MGSPAPAPASLAGLAASLDALLGASAETGERTTLVRPQERGIERLGLALEPDARIAEWAREARLDALLLHRHWRLDPAALPEGVGVLASHAPFDERLGLGANPWLAARLTSAAMEPFGDRAGAPLGMLLALDAPAPAAEVHARLDAEFGGVEAVVPGTAPTVARVATARAMTDALVREATTRGATLYVTGQLRRPADAAVRETGMHVVAVGHARAERWSLALLATLLRERWPGMECVVD